MSTNAAVGGEVCPMLKERAQQALARYQETKNINSSNASLQSLQNLGNYCPYSETCDLIKSRVTYAQQRHNEEGNKNTAAGLDASLGLLAKYCQKNAASQPKVRYPSERPPGPITMRNGLKRFHAIAEGFALANL